MAKVSRSGVRNRSTRIDHVTFEDQQLTRFGGLALIGDFWARIGFNERLRQTLRGIGDASSYGYDRLVGVLVLHQLLGFRELAELDHYRDDPLVRRALGLEQLPSLSTLSRIGHAPVALVTRLRGFLADGVIRRIRDSGLATITLDFDGSVQSTRRHAEGSAVGYNSCRKGERSYYPLLCTVAQLGQVLDVLHRPGNVHDSRGAEQLITTCVERIRGATRGVRLEARLDAAFCAPAIVEQLDALRVAFTVSMHFTRSPAIKEAVEQRRQWHCLDGARDYFELAPHLRPNSCNRRHRIIVVRQRARQRQSGPLQLDLFEPVDTHYTFKAIVTNRRHKAATVVAFHEGRGEREELIGELKSDCGLDYIPAKRLVANQIYLLAGLIAHNLGRELQIETQPATAGNFINRASLWFFHELSTLRRRVLWQPGRLIRPKGRLTLALADNAGLRDRFMHMREALRPASYIA
jgi:hypothetical protein